MNCARAVAVNPLHTPNIAKELRRGIVVRLALILMVLTAATLAWYALEPHDQRSVHEAPAVRPDAVAVSGPVKTDAAAPAQTVPIEAKIQSAAPSDAPAVPAAPSRPAIPDAATPVPSEGMMRTLGAGSIEKPASDEASATGPAIESQAAAKRKLASGAYLQVGVFMHPANAAELKARLEAEGVPVVIATRVQVGPFKSRKEAEEMRAKLKAKGMESLLINQ